MVVVNTFVWWVAPTLWASVLSETDEVPIRIPFHVPKNVVVLFELQYMISVAAGCLLFFVIFDFSLDYFFDLAFCWCKMVFLF